VVSGGFVRLSASSIAFSNKQHLHIYSQILQDVDCNREFQFIFAETETNNISTSNLVVWDICSKSPAVAQQQQFWDEMSGDYWMPRAIEGVLWLEQAAW